MDLNLLHLERGPHRFCEELDTHVLSLNLTTSSAHLKLNLVNLIMFGKV
jgi:hypothetical protein